MTKDLKAILFFQIALKENNPLPKILIFVKGLSIILK